MNIIALFCISIFIILGSIHLYWLLGGKVFLEKALPTKDGKKLLNPSKLMTFAVAVLLFSFSYVSYLVHYEDSANMIGLFVAAIFVLRSIGDFNSVGFFKKIKNTEFAFYDTVLFSPLTLLIGLFLAILSYE